MDAVQNQFRDQIIEEVGEMVFSSTQKIRILIVMCDDTHRLMVSAQKWWRPSRDVNWIAGKGHKLTAKEGRVYSSMVTKACELIENYSN